MTLSLTIGLTVEITFPAASHTPTNSINWFCGYRAFGSELDDRCVGA